jgi:methyl-accepting chemotaxis protein
MQLKDLLKSYFRRLVLEAIFKSSIVGLIIGFSFALIIKLYLFFTLNNSIIIPLLTGLIVSIISAIILYFFKYQPKLTSVASRVDGLGLDERIITSLDIEKKNLDSYIATKQQEDAKEKLAKTNPKQLKLKLFSIPTLILLLVVPLSLGAMAITNNPSSSDISTDQPKDDFAKEIEEIRSIIRNANIYNVQRNELYKMVDDLVTRIKTYETKDEKTSDIKKTKDEIISKIEDYVIGNLLDILRDLIDDAEVRDSFKEELHTQVDDFEVEIKRTVTLAKKIEKTKAFVSELQDSIIDEAVQELRDIVDNASVANEIKNQAYQLIDDLMYRIEHIHETYNQKMEDIKKTKEEILKLLIPPPQDGEEPEPGPSTTTDELDELGQDMQDAIDGAINDLENLQDQKDEEELEGELPTETEGEQGNTGEDQENSQLPPPPKDGDIHNDYIIDGVTPYLQELEKELPGITDILAQGNVSEDIKKLVQSYLELIIKNQDKN